MLLQEGIIGMNEEINVNTNAPKEIQSILPCASINGDGQCDVNSNAMWKSILQSIYALSLNKILKLNINSSKTN